MNPGWTIGTNISSYIKKWYEKTNAILKRSKIKYIYIDKNDQKQYNILIISEDGKEISLFEKYKADNTAYQYIRVYLYLGIIDIDRTNENSGKQDRFIYKLSNKNIKTIQDLYSEIKVNILMWLKNNEIKTLEKENKNNEDKDDDIKDNIYNQEYKFFYSVFWTLFKIKNTKTKKEKFEEFYEDFAQELKKIADSDFWDVVSRLFPLEKSIEDINNSRKMNVDERNCYEYLSNIGNDYNGENFVKANPITFGRFLIANSNGYSIPVFQRKYRWPCENVEVLLDDIFKCNKFHYIGNILLNRERTSSVSNGKFEIVDGQQRITTLLLIIKALYDFSRSNKFCIDTSINNFLKDESNISKKFMHIENCIEEEDFKLIFSNSKDINGHKDKSHFETNYIFIYDWMNSNITTNEKCATFWNNLLNKVYFVNVDIEGGDSFRLFERLNTSNEPLSDFELFKNFILDLFHKKNCQKFSSLSQEKLDEIFEIEIKNLFTSTTGNNNDFKKFITIFLKSENWHIDDESSLFIDLKEFLVQQWIDKNDLHNFNDFIKMIKTEIEIYNYVSKYEKIINNLSPYYNISDILTVLIGRDVYLPLVICIIKKICSDPAKPSKEEIETIRDIVKSIEIYDIRLKLCNYRGQSLSQKVKKIISEIIEMDGSLISPRWLFEKLVGGDISKKIGSLEEMANVLINKDINNKLASRILFRVENFIHFDGWKKKKNSGFKCMYDNGDALSREHIIPVKWKENYYEYLKGFYKNNNNFESDVIDSIDKIGNALPIPKTDNSKSGNKNIQEKKIILSNEAYANDLVLYKGFKLNDIVLEKINENYFNPDVIKKRSEVISEVAKLIYTIDGE